MSAAAGLALLFRRDLLHAVATTQPLVAQVSARDLAGSCTTTTAANTAWQRTARWTLPLAPLLRNLAWVPRIGSDVRVLPDLVDLARAGTATGRELCLLLAPILSSPVDINALPVIARHISTNGAAITAARTDLEQTAAAYARLDPHIDASPRLAPYRDQLRKLGAMLPRAVSTAAILERVAPRLPWALGLDSPRSYILLPQNPFELRPNGGFSGITCLVIVAEARPHADCTSSYKYNVAYWSDTAVPTPIRRYLRLGQWLMRDANWIPDFPSSARVIESFAELNAMPHIDGVISTNLNALVPLLTAIGPIAMDDGTSLTSADVVDRMLQTYYEGSVYMDRQRVGQIVPLILDRLLHAPTSALAPLAGAVQTIAAERQMQLYIDDPVIQGVLAAATWDGGFHPVDGDVVRVVDADVGYGVVNAFVDRQSHYDVALDDNLQPLTATLTLTYTNHYSPWSEASTRQSVAGNCVNLATQRLEAVTGCYADYLRVFVPGGSQLLDNTGLDSLDDVDDQYDRTMFGGFIRVNPGEQRVVQFRYFLPSGTAPTLQIEKQPGTVSPAWYLTAHTSRSQAALWTRAQTDRTIRYAAGPSGLTLDGASDPTASTDFARTASFGRGLDEWQAGAADAAVHTWQSGKVLAWALDYATGLASSGHITAALALDQAVANTAPDARSSYEQAVILDRQGLHAAADRYFAAAASAAPENALAQLTLALRRAAAGQDLGDWQPPSPTSAVVRHIKARLEELRITGQSNAALPYFQLLTRIDPNDQKTAFEWADALISVGKRDEGLRRYQSLAGQPGLWGTLAAAEVASIQTKRDQAIMLYNRALPTTTTWDEALRIGDGLRYVGVEPATEDALRAYDRAATLDPRSFWPLVSAGNLLAATDPVAARAKFEQARRVDPASGYPDYFLGRFLAEQGKPGDARPLLLLAFSKQPSIPNLQEMLNKLPPP
ncbi:MAG: hypothetical protein NVS2B7_14840 [Herpetosiphon sp.]